MLRSIVRPLMFGVGLALVTACGSDATTGVRAATVGTYQLSRVNGQPLPFTEQSSGAVVKVTAGQLDVRTDGSFTESLTRTTTSASGTTTATTTSTGTYTVGDQVIAFAYSGTGLSVLGSRTSAGISIQKDNGTYDYVQ